MMHPIPPSAARDCKRHHFQHPGWINAQPLQSHILVLPAKNARPQPHAPQSSPKVSTISKLPHPRGTPPCKLAPSIRLRSKPHRLTDDCCTALFDSACSLSAQTAASCPIILFLISSPGQHQHRPCPSWQTSAAQCGAQRPRQQ